MLKDCRNVQEQMPNLWCPKTLNHSLIGHMMSNFITSQSHDRQKKTWKHDLWPHVPSSLLRLAGYGSKYAESAGQPGDDVIAVSHDDAAELRVINRWPLLWINIRTRLAGENDTERPGLLDYLGSQMLTQATKLGHFKAGQITFAAKRLPGVCEFEG